MVTDSWVSSFKVLLTSNYQNSFTYFFSQFTTEKFVISRTARNNLRYALSFALQLNVNHRDCRVQWW